MLKISSLQSQLDEALQRLIHIEKKIDDLGGVESDAEVPYQGHPDQIYGHHTYAQHGDDLILLNIFDIIGIAMPSYLDVGAHHPVNISNTALLHKRGSQGVNVEANPHLIQAFIQQRPRDVNLNFGVGDAPGEMTFFMIDKWSGRNSFDRKTAEQFVRDDPRFSITAEIPIRVVTVDYIIENFCQGSFPDLLSIDVEGLESRILKSISYDKWAPKVICTETCRPEDNGDDIARFLGGVGYFPLMKNRGNSFFVHSRYRSVVVGD